MSCFAPLPAIRSLSDPKKVLVGKRSMPGRFAPTLITSTGELIEPFSVPCGRCLGCQIDKSTLWASRLLCEVLEHSPKECYFITLTYNDIHLPKVLLPDGVTHAATLCPDHVTKFLKRFRSRFPDSRIRYFYAGEYGPKTYRPHYHLISFGASIPDLRVYSRNFRGDVYFTSHLMDNLWRFGSVIIGDVTWESCAYVARYTTKKLGNSPDFARIGLVPEFCRMSRRPGIGGAFFDKHLEDYLSYGSVPLPSLPNSKRPRCSSPPRFVVERLKELDPVRVARLKADKLLAMESGRRLNILSSGLEEDAYLDSVAQSLSAKYSALKRNSF